ncbi:GNAT family N-acetyltransferase [Streptomyces sp. NPDC102409]|uniref:GNAT family N-acetyltransferase n=1 Tax=Streptomyces sp. NPDC102409 TaxID=3366172 RepID=UPI003803E761
MPINPLLVRARELWENLARVPISFPPVGGVSVAVSPESELCPVGWIGVVTLGGSAIVTAPSKDAALVVRDELATLPVAAVADAEAVREVLSVARVLGPAALSYVSTAGFRPVEHGALTGEQLPGGHPDLLSLERLASHEDAAEAALKEIDSPAFVFREHGQVVAAAGYEIWPSRTAHISVLTAPEARGRGLARLTASAAVAAGLLPQWRARPPASRRVAAALGFEELGTQLSIDITQDIGGAPGSTSSGTGP